MKKSLLAILLVFTLSGISINAVKATGAVGDDTGGAGLEAYGCETSLSSSNVCRQASDTHTLYVSLTNSATASNGKAIMTGTAAAISAKINQITDNKASICKFLDSAGLGVTCADLEKNCSGPAIDYIYFGITSGFYYKKNLYDDYTVKELANFCTSGSFNGDRFNCSTLNASAISNYLRVTGNNAGVYSATTGPTTNWATMASLSSGYGVAAIKLSDYGFATCTAPGSQYKIVVSANPASCNNTNSTNDGTFIERVVKTASGQANVGKYGKLVDGTTVGKYCKVYCLETANQIFPGNAGASVNIGGYLVWPNTTNNNLKFTGIRTCRFEVDETTLVNDYTAQKNIVNKYYSTYHAVKDVCYATYGKKAAELYAQASARFSACKSETKTCTTYNAVTKKSSSYTCNKSDDDCSSDSEYRSLKSQADEWQNKYNECTTYHDAYYAAKNILKDFNSCRSRNYGNGNDLYHFDTAATITYDDPEYGGTYGLKGTTNYSCDGCGGYSKISEAPETVKPADLIPSYLQVESRIISVNASVQYNLADGYYYFVDKLTKKSVNSTEAGREYVTLGFSNLPISYDADKTSTYHLYVNNTVLGNNGSFNSYLTSYTCNYKVTDTLQCICPVGTEHAGEAICTTWLSDNNSTCADALTKYCDTTSTTETQFCPPADNHVYCPAGTSNAGLLLDACINNGYSESYCASTFCNANTSFSCPSGSQHANMDITSCVTSNPGKGVTTSYNDCVKTKCNNAFTGLNFIYRTISLENPFPGKNISKQVSGFNVDVKGRQPGYNWNSLDLVKNVILQNRGTSGSSVYDKEPLYVITLTSVEIKAIRDYNDKQAQGYADFTLECSGTDSTNCLSNKFLRNSTSGLTGGTCSGRSHSNFYTCDN